MCGIIKSLIMLERFGKIIIKNLVDNIFIFFNLRIYIKFYYYWDCGSYEIYISEWIRIIYIWLI